MKDRMRKALGFLGLIEDEYGEYTPGAAVRPFSEQSVDEDLEWSRPAPAPARQFPTVSATNNVRQVPSAPSPRPAPISVVDSSSQTPRLRPMTSGVRSASPFSQERDVAIFTPMDYNESRRITELLRSNRAVVMIVSQVDADVARRLTDFAAGVVHALNARIERLEKGVFLISPQGTHVSPEVRERLRASNYQMIGS